MPKLNENYLNLKESYLFSEIAHRVNTYTAANPDKTVIRLGIGDVTLPIGSKVIAELHEGVDALASAETFKGYGPEQGYEFLRRAIVDYYSRNNVIKYLYQMAPKVIPETLPISLTGIMSS